MSAYFSQLLAQSGLPAANPGSGQANQAGGFQAAEPPQAASATPSGAESLLPEIETLREAPVVPKAPASFSPAQPPEAAPFPLQPNLPPPAEVPGANPGTRLVKGMAGFEQEEIHPVSPPANTSETKAKEGTLPTDWMSAFEQARAWVAADPNLVGPTEQPEEAAARPAERTTPTPEIPLVERQIIIETPAGQPANTLPFTEQQPVEQPAPKAALLDGNDSFTSSEEPDRQTENFSRPGYFEQHQELNLTIGSILVTVEGPPVTPERKPALQSARDPGEGRGNRSNETGMRWQRHYLRPQ
jgi:hypothetical protein